MASNSFFSQYRRFALGTVSASDFAYWVLSHADEMEPLLDRDAWDLYLDMEILAAEFSGGYIDEAQVRKQFMELPNDHRIDLSALGINERSSFVKSVS